MSNVIAVSHKRLVVVVVVKKTRGVLGHVRLVVVEEPSNVG